MSDFKTAVLRVYKYEGGYDNDPADMGGETYRGISRKYSPHWHGWLIIDKHVKAGKRPIPGTDNELDEACDQFYREKWDRLKLGDLKSDSLAGKIYQQLILMGEAWTVMRVQEACRLYVDLNVKIDGIMGPGTIACLNRADDLKMTVYIVRSITAAQLAHHESTVIRKPDQARFLCGWSNRAWGE